MLKTGIFFLVLVALSSCSGGSSDSSAFKDYDLKSPCAGNLESPCETRTSPLGNKKYL